MGLAVSSTWVSGMSEKFLNSGSIFKCSICPTVKIQPREIMNHRTTFGGRTVLTTTTQMFVMTLGICPYSEIPPNQAGVTCIPRLLAGNWTKFSKHTAGGKNILIESSEFLCAASKAKGGDGRITVDTNAVNNVVQDRYALPVLTKIGDSPKVSDRKKPDKNTAGNVSNKTGGNAQSGKGESFERQKEDAVEEYPAVEDLYCPYDRKKEKCKSCKYLQSNSEHMESAQRGGSSKQPGVILRENYEAGYDVLGETRKYYVNPCRTIDEEYALFTRINCGNAAHHILSTKDVYEQDKLKFVLKLANFYGYDVNEAYNCIILPGLNAFEERNKTEFQVKFGKETDYEKRKFKYYSMRESGRQWHGGGHGKDFENEHNISCYAAQVTDLLYSYMKNETKQHCRIEEAYFEKDKERFIRIIHHVIDIVRKKLISFEVKPQNSLPFFVSADAYNYAFGARNIRLLVFRKRGEKIEVYKYMITRKNGITFPDERARREFDLSDSISRRRLIAFCEQIEIAYIDICNGRFTLPFSIRYKIEVNMKDISVSDYFKINISSVEAETAEFDKAADDGNIMKNRLLEMKGL